MTFLRVNSNENVFEDVALRGIICLCHTHIFVHFLRNTGLVPTH
jgi:hypothetical protein